MGRRAVIALGGNAVLRHGRRGAYAEQFEAVAATARVVAGLVAGGMEVAVTHGNGPQVGNLLVQNELARPHVPAMPLFSCVAQTQGLLGEMLQRTLQGELTRLGLERPVLSLITLVEVSSADPALLVPTKPVGPYYTEGQARAITTETGCPLVEVPGRGWRRVVPSPAPVAVWGAQQIDALLDQGCVVVAAGGGGVPVMRGDAGWEGVDAVVDKDLSASLLARQVRADLLLILTEVEHVALHFGTPRQRNLEEVSPGQLRAWQAEGHFGSGSMGPKVEAALQFAATGGTAIITDLDHAAAALRGEGGTRVCPEPCSITEAVGQEH